MMSACVKQHAVGGLRPDAIDCQKARAHGFGVTRQKPIQLPVKFLDQHAQKGAQASGLHVEIAGGAEQLGQVRIRPPLPKPSNIVAMAVNYMEDGTRAEPAPINAFLKSPRCWRV